MVFFGEEQTHVYVALMAFDRPNRTFKRSSFSRPKAGSDAFLS
jgi:hypothetical protein